MTENDKLLWTVMCTKVNNLDNSTSDNAHSLGIKSFWLWDLNQVFFLREKLLLVIVFLLNCNSTKSRAREICYTVGRYQVFCQFPIGILDCKNDSFSEYRQASLVLWVGLNIFPNKGLSPWTFHIAMRICMESKPTSLEFSPSMGIFKALQVLQ